MVIKVDMFIKGYTINEIYVAILNVNRHSVGLKRDCNVSRVH